MAKKRLGGQLAAAGGAKVGGQLAGNLAVNFLSGKYGLMAKKRLGGHRPLTSDIMHERFALRTL